MALTVSGCTLSLVRVFPTPTGAMIAYDVYTGKTLLGRVARVYVPVGPPAGPYSLRWLGRHHTMRWFILREGMPPLPELRLSHGSYATRRATLEVLTRWYLRSLAKVPGRMHRAAAP